MSEKMKDGGPAFAHFKEDAWGNARVVGGMTLRDYFAGQALPAMVRYSGSATAAAEAYRLADAMLFVREIRNPSMNIDEIALDLARKIHELPPVEEFKGGRAQRVSRIQIMITDVLEAIRNG